MSKKGAVPDAWDEDWENIADKVESKPPEPAPKLTKYERRAQHQEQQKQLWDSAENPDRFHWLETQGVVPLKQEFKPQVKLLSRKPVAPTVSRRDAANGVANLTLDDGEDSEEERRKKIEADSEERARQAKIEREEKLRKYAEARERIMGTPSQGQNTGREPREGSHGRENRKSRGKPNGSNKSSQPTSSEDQSPARAQDNKQLFDPDDMGRRTPKRESTPKEDLPSRQPRGPERGGFGFAARGGKTAT